MVEMVCLHVISLMEALQECNSTIFVKVCYNPDICSVCDHLNEEPNATYICSLFPSVDSHVAADDSVKPQGKTITSTDY